MMHHRGNWPQYPVFRQKKACASDLCERRHLRLHDRDGPDRRGEYAQQ
jgi:hypothetical protein